MPRNQLSLWLITAGIAACSATETPHAGGSATDAGSPEDERVPSTVDSGVILVPPNDSGATTDAPVVTATVTWDGTTETSVPAVRRGLNFFQPVSRSVSVTTSDAPPVFNCGLDVAPEAGGRYLRIDSVSIAGNFGGPCSSNLSRIDGAETSLTLSARNACGGKGTCTYDARDSFDLLLGECNPSSVLLSYDYSCMTLTPAPAFVFEHQSAQRTISILGSDALGRATCENRGAAFYVDEKQWRISASSPCIIDITSRTERSLVGTMEANLVDAEDVEHHVNIAFRHESNGMRSLAAIHTGSDLCGTNTITHAEVVDGDETYDVFTSSTLSCQVTPSATLPGFELRRRRPRAGAPNQDFWCATGRVNLSSQDTSTSSTGGGCDRAFVVSESDDRLRFVFYNAHLCSAAGTCQPAQPIVYFQYDLRPPTP